MGEWLPEPIVTDPAGGAPGVLQVDESVSMALLLLLERLTPPERAVFLLQEIFETDGGGKAPALPAPIFGRDKVARALLQGYKKLMSLNVLQQITHVNGTPGIVSYLNGRPQSVFIVEASEEGICAIYVVTNPEKLSHLPAPPS